MRHAFPALVATALLAAHKIAVRVVSMPSTTTFDKQKTAYKTEVLMKCSGEESRDREVEKPTRLISRCWPSIPIAC